MKHRMYISLLLLWPLCHQTLVHADQSSIDYSSYEKVLETYVNQDGFVDYAGLMKNRVSLDEFVKHLDSIDPAGFEKLPETHRLAFWINAYNALTLKGVVDHYPVKSFKEVGSFFVPVWDKLKFNVMGRVVTLSEIEHKILRKEFNEPRIHVAINCAAFDCPRLLNTPYLPGQLEKQLTEQSNAFIGHPGKFHIDQKRGVVKLSRIFDWFGEDFIGKYFDESKFRGKSEKIRAVLNYASAHLTEADRAYLAKNTFKVAYFDYNWSLNKQR